MHNSECVIKGALRADCNKVVVMRSLALLRKEEGGPPSGGGRSYSRFAKRNISRTKYISHRQIYRTVGISHPKGIKGSSLSAIL